MKDHELLVGLVLLTHAPSGSGAGLLLYDRGGAGLEAVVGDYGWLDDRTVDLGRSVHVRGSAFLAEVARAAAGLWRWSGDSDSEAADRWRRVADRCQDQAAISAVADGAEPGLVEATLVVDDEHASLATERSQQAVAEWEAPLEPTESTVEGRIGNRPRELTLYGGYRVFEANGAIGIRGITVGLHQSSPRG
jgi:hypothetical protein